MATATKQRRTLTVPALDPAGTQKTTLIKFCGTSMRLGIRPTFNIVLNGALIGRTLTAGGEMVQIYHPMWKRWESYPIAHFESSFGFKVPNVIGMGDFGIVAEVFHVPSGTDYDRDYRRADVQVLLRMFKDQPRSVETTPAPRPTHDIFGDRA